MTKYEEYYYRVGHVGLTYLSFAQFVMGQQVWLMNPQSARQKAACRTVSGING
jgi:hypothetical protein